MIPDYDKAVAELPILRGFIDFVNKQSGVYMDCLSGFQGNIVRTERQVHRMQIPAGKKIKDGQAVVVWTSVEDPSKPDVLHHRIIRAKEFVSDNSEASFNEQQVCWSIIVFIFAYWDEEIRPQIARVRGVAPNDVKIDALGDLRIARKAIIHNKGIITKAEYAKMKKMSPLFKPDEKISLSHDEMHILFVHLKQAIGELVLKYTGHLPGAPKSAEVVGIAIQNTPRDLKRN